jgi:hypothetical protein
MSQTKESPASWSSRAWRHGRRLAAEGRALSDDLIGRLARHEGADVTYAATLDFGRAVCLAYAKQITDVGFGTAMPGPSQVPL